MKKKKKKIRGRVRSGRGLENKRYTRPRDSVGMRHIPDDTADKSAKPYMLCMMPWCRGNPFWL